VTQTERIRIKRAYESPARGDRVRILVDRLWSRGLRKGELRRVTLFTASRDLAHSEVAALAQRLRAPSKRATP
jgi:uncharacterized protein YeaO (DUF488 family)